MKTIAEFELIDHGIEHSQYFQGCGTLPEAKFDSVATGIGDNPAEAIDDAIEQLATEGWNVESLEEQILTEEGWKELPLMPEAHEDCEVYRNKYKCEGCQEEWDDVWSCQCNDKCPKCDAEIEPYESEDIRDHDECELHYMVSIRVKESK